MVVKHTDSHQRLKSKTMLAFGRLAGSRVRIWPRETGQGWVGGTWRELLDWKGNKVRALVGASPVRYGIEGGADLEGIGEGGIHIEVEIKTRGGRPDAGQRNFAAMISRFGGIYEIAYAEDDEAEDDAAEDVVRAVLARLDVALRHRAENV